MRRANKAGSREGVGDHSWGRPPPNPNEGRAGGAPYLDVWREEGELQRPSELDARGDHAGEHELGPVLGRRARAPSGSAAVEADELHLGVAEVAVGHSDGRGPGAGVHGGRAADLGPAASEIWGSGSAAAGERAGVRCRSGCRGRVDEGETPAVPVKEGREE
jgi:hypothetical protein